MSIANGATTPEWLDVTPSDPCAICDKPDWCSASKDGVWALCRRRNRGDGKEKTDESGNNYYVHRLIAKPESANKWREPEHSHTEAGGKRADPDTLDRVYLEFLKRLHLSDAHERKLKARGLEHGLRVTGFRTLGKGRAKAAYGLVEAGLESLLPGVPGFYVQTNEKGGHYWSVAGGGGILIPIRDAQRRIVALQVRADTVEKGSRYRYVSSKKKGGVGPGAPVHFPLFKGETATVRVTEGALKADVATHRSGMLTIGLSSVAGWKCAADAANAVGATTVRLAFDADARTNLSVAAPLERCAADLAEKGFAVQLELWDAADGKGIDDLLAAGKQPRVLTGGDVTPAVVEIVQAAKAANPPPGGVTPADEESLQPSNSAKEALDDPHRLARLILERLAHEDRPRLAYYREQFWRWDRCWGAAPDAEIRADITGYVKWELDQLYALLAAAGGHDDDEIPTVTKVTTALVSNVVQALTGEVLLKEDTPQPSWIGLARGSGDCINLANGILDVKALLDGAENFLLPHTPLWFSPVCLPYAYDPAAECPRWEAFLERNLGDDPGKAVLLQRYAGYLLRPDTSYQRFLMMVGEGANGKSVVCAVLCALLGTANVSSVPLEMFADKFRLAGTLGKLANIAAEVGELDKVAEGQIKAFVTGDPMEFERKFKTPFSARPTARLVLATNNPPQFSDKSDGIWRRMLLLMFTIQIPENERVAGMDTVGFWEASGELPGILNWALAGLDELREVGRFVVPPSCQQEAERLRVDANPARRFLLEHYEMGQGEPTVAEVYADYKKWCEENGHHRLAEIGFGKEVARAFRAVKKAKKVIAGKGRPWCYYGLTRVLDELDG